MVDWSYQHEPPRERIRTMYLTDWDLEAERASVMAEQQEEREAEARADATANL